MENDEVVTRNTAGIIRLIRNRLILCLELFISLPGCFLLGAAARGACSRSAKGRFRNHAFHLKLLLVGFARGGDNNILRESQSAALQVLLQEGLGVFAQYLRIQSLEQGSEKTDDNSLGFRKTSIKINCSQNRFQRIGEYRGASISTAFELPLTESDQSAQLKRLRQFCQCLLIDKIGTYSR